MMITVSLAHPTYFEGWRNAARCLIGARIRPEDVFWRVADEPADLFASAEPALSAFAPDRFSVSRAFLTLAQRAILHRDPERFALLYRLLWLLQAEPHLASIATDPLIVRLENMMKAVGRDLHKMKAFVRFRKIAMEEREVFVAWFEPDHHIVEAGGPFFTRRFASMRWSILTPDRCAHWDGDALTFSPGLSKEYAPAEDAIEAYWLSYYASIFNPARLKVKMMRTEMPERYWRNLPEAALIKPLIATASRRREAMIGSVSIPKPNRHRMFDGIERPKDTEAGSLREQAAGCQACPLWEHATQTVFGEGPVETGLMFVGEAPGDKEDIAGRPFIGPAGQLFNRALEEAGLDRAGIYLTNAVKHFKFMPKGRIRIHEKPNTSEIKACRPWLMREIDMVRPSLIVALGATAAQSLFGKPMTIGKHRGHVIDIDETTRAFITVHPSYLLRIPNEVQKREEYERFIEELKRIRQAAGVIEHF